MTITIRLTTIAPAGNSIEVYFEAFDGFDGLGPNLGQRRRILGKVLQCLGPVAKSKRE